MYSFSTFKILLEVTSWSMVWERKVRWIGDKEMEVPLSSAFDDTISYIQNPKEIPQLFKQLVNSPRQ